MVAGEEVEEEVVVGWKADRVEMEAWAVEGREVEEEVVKR